MPPEFQPYSEPEHQPFEFGNGSHAALLIHGFPGTPAEMRGIGHTLAENGWHVRGPLLPGFGPDIVNLAKTRRGDWLGALNAEWAALRQAHKTCALVGYSMGGALALHLAQEKTPDQLVLISPFWRLPGFLPRLVPVLKLVMRDFRPFKNVDFGSLEVREQFERLMPGVDLEDPEVQSYIRDQITLPMKTIDEVLRLGREAFRLAKSIRVPTLIVQGSEDGMVQPDLSRRLGQRLGGESVIYREMSGGHELIHQRSAQATAVAELILGFLKDWNGLQDSPGDA